jgi:hypothetical protein
VNKHLEQYARQYLKDGLGQLPESNQVLFKQMYSHEYHITTEGESYPMNNSVANLDKEINAVVDDMPADKLDWAMQQVDRTLRLWQKLKSIEDDES